ncbi:hypothetical protein DFQ27_008090 [Actinomortierella ambigua]|uniref:Secreted protein n=1 Tax=Actinomortierella ambigua TaxID=1343610 RepID=A0A9P6PUM1_9FUNG|nr:hypothetical protein DFQ26_000150 [Actinomortierella ambigua]KAG0252411.1 hypothetical protein DFQ27_008090 [Actinomortierella ambigua]
MKTTALLAVLAPIVLLWNNPGVDANKAPPRAHQAPPPPPQQKPYTLITYEQAGWKGNYQMVDGYGCKALSGAAVSSFQGHGDYQFHLNPGCSDRYIYDGDDTAQSIMTIYPKSVYIRHD